jgi:GDPmannose 4,6-dehydratase
MNYLEAYSIYASSGILFHHESPRRGETFVTRKIHRGMARIDAGLEECLFMGNIDSLRYWGNARDYVEMQWRMLQQQGPPEGFVIAEGRQESVRRFIELATAELGWGGSNCSSGPAIQLQGEGINEIGRSADTNAVVAKIDPHYIRPAEVENLLGNPSKAQEKLAWGMWRKWWITTRKKQPKQPDYGVRDLIL